MTKLASVNHKLEKSASTIAPSFEFTNGIFHVTVISDGHLTIPHDIFTADATAPQRDAVLSRLDTGAGVVNAPTNIPVLRCRNEVIVFDIGGGDRYQPTDGKFLHNLRAAGFDEREVTKVVFTHAHPDHIGATLAQDGDLNFPNATYFVGSAEWNFWTDPDFFRKAPAALHGFGRDARRDLSAVKDRMVSLKPGDDVVTGIRAIDTPGHTPGHMSFEIEGEDGLIIAADVATSEIVAIENPNWKFGYDIDPDLAIETRKRLLDRASADRTKLLGFHWTFPGTGFVEVDGTAYRFVPSK